MDIIQAISQGDLSFVKNYFATETNFKPLLKNLNSYCVCPDVIDTSVLFTAIEKNHTEVVLLVLSELQGININRTGKQGNTYLMRAAERGNMPILTALLAYPEIELDLQNKFKNTALLLAVRNQHVDAAITLAQSGANITIQNDLHQSAEAFFKNKTIQEATFKNLPEQTLEKFIDQRQAIAKNLDKVKDLELKEEINQAMQELANLSCKSIVADFRFIQDHLNKINEISELDEVCLEFANLVASLGEQDKLARTLYEAAAKMGNQNARHIVSHFGDNHIPPKAQKEQPSCGKTLGGAGCVQNNDEMREARLKFFEKIKHVSGGKQPTTSKKFHR